MSRQLLVAENETWPNGFFIEEESVVWEKGDPIPLYSPNGGEDVRDLIGKVTEIRREGLHITGEVTFLRGREEVDWRHYNLSSYLSGVILVGKNVKRARLRAVSLMPKMPTVITDARLFAVSIVENPPHPSQTIQVVEK